MMRCLLAALLLAASLSAAGADVRTWDFRVLLDGREIGQHHFVLRDAGGERELRSEARFDVRLLKVSVYRYVHEAVERWDGDCLTSLVSRTQTNGRRQAVNAAVRDGLLAVEGSKGRDEHGGCIMSFAYWNPRVLQARQLLNSQTGELLPVTITPRGEESIEVRGERRVATRHHIAGRRLEVDLWYDGAAWLALEALTAGGQRLRYELM